MGDVFANGREVSGKATPNKSIAAFPSVCLSPPSPPAGPIPIPYPVTSMASDTNDGTGSVKVKKKEAGHKNGSVYKKCNGNQPATKSFGMDVLSHTTEGKTKFAAYSFDVLFEGDGAERFLDLTTSNHMNSGGAPMVSGAKPDVAPPPPDADCAELKEANEEEFSKAKDAADAKKPAKKRARIADEDQPGITISHAKVNGGAMRKGTSSSVVRELVPGYDADPNKPLNKSQRTKDPKSGKSRYAMDVCPPAGENEYLHPTGMEHAEIHILNSLSGIATAGGPKPKLLFGIEWHKSFKGKLVEVSPDACPVCQGAIQHACECFDISICNDDGQPVSQCPEAESGAGV